MRSSAELEDRHEDHCVHSYRSVPLAGIAAPAIAFDGTTSWGEEGRTS